MLTPVRLESNPEIKILNFHFPLHFLSKPNRNILSNKLVSGLTCSSEHEIKVFHHEQQDHWTPLEITKVEFPIPKD